MANNAQSRLKQLQKNLYDEALSRAKESATVSAPILEAYGADFNNSLPQHGIPINQSKFMAKVEQANMVLFGDFHTLEQSQQSFLHVASKFLQEHPSQTIVFALEMFRQLDQTWIDRFLQGKVTEDDLLKKTNYRKRWGFSWRQYSPLLHFAKEHGIKIVGINDGQSGKNSLAQRDEKAARVLAETFAGNPEAKIFCLIGEFHLAENHLPQATHTASGKHKPQILRILHNIDRFGIEAFMDFSNDDDQYLQLKDDLVCMINIAPWLKWQSLSHWEESQDEEAERTNRSNAEDVTFEQPVDAEYHLVYLMRTIVAFLQLKIGSSNLENFKVSSLDQLCEILAEAKESPTDLNVWTDKLNLDGYLVLPYGPTAILENFNLGNLAYVAGEMLFCLLAEKIELLSDHENFLYRVAKAAAGTIGAKILNPKLKGISFEGYRKVLACESKAELVLATELAKPVLEFYDLVTKGNEQGQQDGYDFGALDRQLNFGLSQKIGRALGLQVYASALKGDILAEHLLGLFSLQKSSREFIQHQVYRLILLSKESVDSPPGK